MSIERETKLWFQLFGKAFCLDSEIEIGKNFLNAILPANAVYTEEVESVIGTFYIASGSHKRPAGLYWEEELLNELEDYHLENPQVLDCKIQYALASALSPQWTFIHSGAVSIHGKGVIMPGLSKHGKTTLTKAFLKAGAEYLTDDCTVIGPDGSIYPYATPLKLRISDNDDERELKTADHFGSRVSTVPVPLHCIVFTGYVADAEWSPSEITIGETVWNLIEQLYYGPVIREHPGEVMAQLTHLAERSLRFRGERGEAEYVVSDILERLERV